MIRLDSPRPVPRPEPASNPSTVASAVPERGATLELLDRFEATRGRQRLFSDLEPRGLQVVMAEHPARPVTPASVDEVLATPGGEIRQGDAGPAVLDVQRLLGLSAGGQTSIYGPTTAGYVKSFQAGQSGLRNDGVADGPTIRALLRSSGQWAAAPTLEAVERGRSTVGERMEGPAITALQRALGFRGPAADGRFGADTLAAVEDAQRGAGLEATGVVDAEVWAAIREQRAAPAPEPALADDARFSLTGSVGAGGTNAGADVEKVRGRLVELGFPSDDLQHGIRLFQSAIWGRNTLGGDGRVDPGGSTHRWLQAQNAPRWQPMPDRGPGRRNIDDNDHDYGTSWAADLIGRAGEIYQANHLSANPGDSPISTNNLSRPRGGDTPFHSSHETGMNVDISLPRTDGSFGGYYWDRGHDHEATKAQLRALIQAGARTILYNDPRVLQDPEFSGKVVAWPGHDHHMHVVVPVPERVDAARPKTPGGDLKVYPPGSPEQITLFEEAARVVGVPEAWASDPGLHQILERESGGRVGVPNYTYGERARDPARWPSVHAELRGGQITARSSATGLGQLLLDNVERHYPSGRDGIGVPLEEAAGMLSYIRERYGHPAGAWRLYGVRHEGY